MQNHRRNLPMQKARWTTAVATAALLALPVASCAQPVGRAGGAAAETSQLDPAVRAKLIEFRTHLKEFEKGAGGSTAAGGSMPPSAPTPTTSNPANPASTASPMNPTSPANPAN